jgi:hypothetical protein
MPTVQCSMLDGRLHELNHQLSCLGFRVCCCHVHDRQGHTQHNVYAALSLGALYTPTSFELVDTNVIASQVVKRIQCLCSLTTSSRPTCVESVHRIEYQIKDATWLRLTSFDKQRWTVLHAKALMAGKLRSSKCGHTWNFTCRHVLTVSFLSALYCHVRRVSVKHAKSSEYCRVGKSMPSALF